MYLCSVGVSAFCTCKTGFKIFKMQILILLYGILTADALRADFWFWAQDVNAGVKMKGVDTSLASK